MTSPLLMLNQQIIGLHVTTMRYSFNKLCDSDSPQQSHLNHGHDGKSEGEGDEDQVGGGALVQQVHDADAAEEVEDERADGFCNERLAEVVLVVIQL